MTLELTEPEAESLRDIIGWWLEDFDEAILATDEAPPEVYNNSLELYTKCTDGIRQDRVDAEVLRAKLEMALGA